MKLYYSAGSCSTSCHIVLEESGLKYEAIAVDWDDSNDPNTTAVSKMNPLGTLPIMVTDEGKQLDQNISIQTYIADKVPEKKLLPSVGTIERAEAMNYLSFVAADLHKCLGTLFAISSMSPDKSVQDVVRKFYVGRSNSCLQYLNDKLNGKDYLMGKNFTVADAYAFVVTSWTKYLEIPIAPFKNIQSYLDRVASRPAVAKVLKVEGLLD